MTLRMLKPELGYLKTGLAPLHHAPLQVVERVDGNSMRALKKRALARSGSLCECEQCRASGLPIKLTWATCQLDHHIPLYQGGDNSMRNMRALHVDCHARITKQQAQERAAGGLWSDRL